jgi:aspartyl/asparaginyl beta-hydroxylase (cupin superfamily)
LIAAAPDHPRALFERGRRLIRAGDPAGALALLLSAEAHDRSYAEIPFYSALAYRMQGDFEKALLAIDRALAIDAYFFMALLSKGMLFEKLGKPRLAARTYRNAIKIAPPVERMPSSQRTAFERARTSVAEYANALAEHLRASSAALRGAHGGEPMRRFDESLEILAGLKQRQVHDPILFYYAGLPAIPFYERSYFPWLPKLEAATDTIRIELERVLREDLDKFAPYVQMPPEAPVNQWIDLNHSKLWSTAHFWRDGQQQADMCDRCPNTAEILEALPMAHQPGFAPTALFSMLAPQTRIPPHTGSTNVRLIAHLPLILPEKCGFRVGNETREWRMGEAWVFDDTIEHEAWNDSPHTRVILIFDVWNPLLSDVEHELVSQTLNAFQQFNADE